MPLEIMILSDNADVRRHLNHLVGAHPAWNVIGKMTCDKALTGIPRKGPPDIIVAEISRLDASMIPMISAIRDKFVNSKILAISDHQDSRLVLRMIHAGINGYLIMERAAEELIAAIETVASGGIYLSPGIAGLAGRRQT